VCEQHDLLSFLSNSLPEQPLQLQPRYLFFLVQFKTTKTLEEKFKGGGREIRIAEN
jgi:hypothetical protein